MSNISNPATAGGPAAGDQDRVYSSNSTVSSNKTRVLGGPITIQTDVLLTVQTDATLVVI